MTWTDIEDGENGGSVRTKLNNLGESNDLKAPLESPDFTGTPTVPTASPGTDTDQAASTAFVEAVKAQALGSETLKATGATLEVNKRHVADVGGSAYTVPSCAANDVIVLFASDDYASSPITLTPDSGVTIDGSSDPYSWNEQKTIILRATGTDTWVKSLAPDAGGEILYAANLRSANDGSTTIDTYLDVDSVPAGWMNGSASWFFAAQFAVVSNMGTNALSIVTSDSDTMGIRPQGDYFVHNNSLIAMSPNKPLNSGDWVVMSYDGSELTCWVDSEKVVDADSESFGSGDPGAAAIMGELTASYTYQMGGNLLLNLWFGNEVLTDPEAESLLRTVTSLDDITFASKVDNAWNFGRNGPNNAKGSIGLSEVLGTDAVIEYVPVAPPEYGPPTLADGALTVNNDTTGDFDLSSVLSNPAGDTVTYAKVSGAAHFGAPNPSTGILTVDANGQSAGDQTAVYSVSNGVDPAAEMTLTATITAYTTDLSEDWESGLNGWTAVTDPSAGSTAHQDLVISGATTSKYDETYPVESGINFRISTAGIVDTSYSDFKVFAFDAGGGTWYLCCNNYNTGQWHLRTTTTDPSTIVNGTDLSTDTDLENVTASSTTQDGEFVPFPSGIVSYDGGTFTPVNNWEVGTATSESGTQSAYISVDGGTSNEYENSTAAVTHLYKDVAIPSGTVEAILEFDWKCQGESSYDFLRVFVAPDSVTPVGGTEVSSAYNIDGPSGRYNQSGSWNSESVDITSLAPGNTTVRVIFQWKNDSFGGTNPPAAVDGISLRSTT